MQKYENQLYMMENPFYYPGMTPEEYEKVILASLTKSEVNLIELYALRYNTSKIAEFYKTNKNIWYYEKTFNHPCPCCKFGTYIVQ